MSLETAKNTTELSRKAGASAVLVSSLERLQRDVTILEQENRLLREEIRLLRHKRFAPSAETISPGQGSIFNESEALADAPKPAEEPEAATPVAGHTRNKPKRQPIPEDLPRNVIRIELPEEQRQCNCGHPLHEMGVEASEQYDFIPAKVTVDRFERVKYGCRACEGTIKTPPMPPQPIPKSLAGPGLLAHVATSKYADGLPLYRLEGILKRAGIEVSRGTMAAWMVRVGELVTPLVNLMRDELLAGDVIHCDETPLQVLKETGRDPTTKSWMWVMCRGAPGTKVVLFNYERSRAATVPLRLLDTFKGHLHVDGLGSYNAVTSREGVVRIGCWAHVRRKFYDAFKGTKNKDTIAKQGLDWIKALYAVEKPVELEPPDVRLAARREEAKPLLAEIRAWLDAYINVVTPKSLTGKALAYLNGEWPNLVRYADTGTVRLDNNIAENAIRPFVVGRKAWLFADTPSGADASAALYSVIETAKANGHEPYAYLREVLRRLPASTRVEEYEALLPWRLQVGKT